MSLTAPWGVGRGYPSLQVAPPDWSVLMEESDYATAGLVALAMALIKLVEKGFAKANSDSAATKASLLEVQVGALAGEVEELKTKLCAFHDDFISMRESIKIYMAVQKASKGEKDD